MDRGFRTMAVVLAVVVGVLLAALGGQDRVVVLRAARIRAAGPAAQVPAGAQVIDLGDATLSPGFIDAHTHLTGMFIVDYKQAIIDGLRQTIPEQNDGVQLLLRGRR